MYALSADNSGTAAAAAAANNTWRDINLLVERLYKH